MSKAKSIYTSNQKNIYKDNSFNSRSRENLVSSKPNSTRDLNNKKDNTSNVNMSPNSGVKSHALNLSSVVDLGELCFNVNDDWRTLIAKNAKLRQIVVNASDKIVEQVILMIYKG